MSDSCTRCNKAIFAAEKPQRVPGGIYHDACFKCETCGVKLTLKTLNSREGKVFCGSHKPVDAPNQCIDASMATALSAPDSSMSKREFGKSDASHSYGAGAVGVEGALKAPKPPTTVNNINQMEVRHQGVAKFGSA